MPGAAAGIRVPGEAAEGDSSGGHCTRIQQEGNGQALAKLVLHQTALHGLNFSMSGR